MFTYNLNISAANLLKSVHFLTQCALFPTTASNQHYNSLTLSSAPTKPKDAGSAYTLTLSPDAAPNTLKNTRASTETHSSGGFIAGWLGVIDYPNDQPVINKSFSYFSFTILIDTENDTCTAQSLTGLNSSELTSISDELNNAIELSSITTQAVKPRTWTHRWNKAQYNKAFNRVKSYLASGDTYQINLAMPFVCHDDLTNASPYALLTKFNGRHACYIKRNNRTIFSVSPERLIHINGQDLTTSPIKGTAPRSNNLLIDRQNAADLTASTKNQAENLMIVDLLRNDLSIHALPHSVKVEKLYELESHHNVHHLVSTISAKLKPDTILTDAIRDIFPGGSITGAPKKRAMEIIKELEAQPRGAYCGSFGYIDDRGICDFNILIRTIEAKKEGAVCWGGGGIVIDSELESEYQEIFNKVQQILDTPL
jgi:para-aminobenzoate synthetase component 1